MSKSQRTKGASYEREVARFINEKLDLPAYAEVKRNIGQARDGGNDLDVGPLVVECKRRKTLGTVESWLQQATDAAVEKNRNSPTLKYPAVIAREDGGDNMVIMRAEDFFDLFGDVIADGLLSEIGGADVEDEDLLDFEEDEDDDPLGRFGYDHLGIE